MDLHARLTKVVKGEVRSDAATMREFSRDTSIFERTPRAVVFPKDADDVSAAVKTVLESKQAGEDTSITARSAGTRLRSEVGS